MEMQTLTVKLPPRVISELAARAEAEDVTPGTLLRLLLQKELAQGNAAMPSHAHKMQPLRAKTAAEEDPGDRFEFFEPF